MNVRQFAPEDAKGTILLAWWRGLEKDKGGRADLRRCRTLTNVVLTPAYQDLYHKLADLLDARAMARLPTVAALVATVKTWEPGIPQLPVQMAQKIGDREVVSELRFRRLLQCKDQEELFQSLRRVIRLLDQRADIPSLANGVYSWGDKIRQEWAYAYYGQSGPGETETTDNH